MDIAHSICAITCLEFEQKENIKYFIQSHCIGKVYLISTCANVLYCWELSLLFEVQIQSA